MLALVVRAGVRKGLGFLKLNDRVESGTGSKIDLQGGIAKGAYYLILLLALIGFFNVLSLQLVSGPLQSLVDQVFAYAPRLAVAGLLILVAWILAMVLRKLVTKALSSTKLDEKLSADAGVRPISDSLGNVLYWLVILLFLPGILGTLGLEGLLLPMQGMVDRILGVVPNIFAATILALVGWFVARLLRDLVSNLLAAIPNIFAAVVILGVAWFVSGFVAGLGTNLLGGVGFDELPAKLGIKGALPGSASPAALVGKIVVFFAMLFASVEAANRLGFTQVSEFVATFIEFGGQVLLGVVIIAVGLWISNLAYGAIRGLGGANIAFFAGLARYAILGLVFTMGLRAMGIADDIVDRAFTLTLGAVAVAVALSFGLGGREAAGKQMEHWLGRLRGER